MPNQEEQELLDVAEALEEADAAYKHGDYKRAEPIYKRALELMEARYGSGDPDTIVCLQKLGDTYYALRKFDEALPLYRRLLLVGEKVLGKNHPDVVAMAIKLGSTYERMDMGEDAAAMYQRAQKLSQSSLIALRSMPGAAEVSEEERARRGRFVDPKKLTGNFLENEIDQESLDLSDPKKAPSWKNQQPKDSNKVDAAEPVKTSFNRSRPGARKQDAQSDSRGALMHLLRQNSSIIAGGAALLVLLAFGIFVFLKLSSNGPTVSKPAVVKEHFRKQVYATADGTMSIVVNSPVDANFVVGTGQMQASTRMELAQMGPEWGDFGGVILGSLLDKEYWFEKTPQGLCNEDGGMLYTQGSPESKVISILNKVASRAQIQYQTNKTYPTSENGFADMVYQNPSSLRSDVPSLHEYISPTATAGGLASDGSDDQYIFSTLMRVATGRWQKENPAAPCMVHCVTVQKGYTAPPSSEFYAHGFDRNGQLLIGNRAGESHLIALKNGVSQINAHFPKLPTAGARPLRICIVKLPAGIPLLLMHHIVPAICFAFAIAFFCVSKYSRPKDEFIGGLTVLDRVALVFLILSIVWGVAAVLP